MRIALLQRSIVWEDRQTNFRQIEERVSAAGLPPGTLLVLAEMFATGFSLKVELVGEPEDGPTAEFLSGLAQRHGIAVVGSYPCRDRPADKAVNRLEAFGPDGERLVRYDKIHPFSFGREAEQYRGGDELSVFDYQGWRVCPTVCYDLRFPEMYRSAVLEGGAELLLVVANWPTGRRAHWNALLKARAIENLCWVAGVNRTGEDPTLDYSGDSQLLDERGRYRIEAGSTDGLFQAELDRESLEQWRRDFPALADAKAPFRLTSIDG